MKRCVLPIVTLMLAIVLSGRNPQAADVPDEARPSVTVFPVVISPHNELISPCYHLNKEQFSISNNLASIYAKAEVQQALSMEGKLPECEGCAINCYMQPSFAIELNKYFWQALPSTIKYNRMKGTWKKLLANPSVS